MKQLYEVHMVCYVVAKSKGIAMAVAARQVQESAPSLIEADIATSIDSRCWDAIPWGSDQMDETCGDIVQKRKNVERTTTDRE